MSDFPNAPSGRDTTSDQNLFIPNSERLDNYYYSNPHLKENPGNQLQLAIKIALQVWRIHKDSPDQINELKHLTPYSIKLDSNNNVLPIATDELLSNKNQRLAVRKIDYYTSKKINEPRSISIGSFQLKRLLYLPKVFIISNNKNNLCDTAERSHEDLCIFSDYAIQQNKKLSTLLKTTECEDNDISVRSLLIQLILIRHRMHSPIYTNILSNMSGHARDCFCAAYERLLKLNAVSQMHILILLKNPARIETLEKIILDGKRRLPATATEDEKTLKKSQEDRDKKTIIRILLFDALIAAEKHTSNKVKKEIIADFKKKLSTEEPIQLLKNMARVLSHHSNKFKTRLFTQSKPASYYAAEVYFETARKFADILDSEWKAILTDKNPSGVVTYKQATEKKDKILPTSTPILKFSALSNSQSSEVSDRHIVEPFRNPNLNFYSQSHTNLRKVFLVSNRRFNSAFIITPRTGSICCHCVRG